MADTALSVAFLFLLLLLFVLLCSGLCDVLGSLLFGPFFARVVVVVYVEVRTLLLQIINDLQKGPCYSMKTWSMVQHGK